MVFLETDNYVPVSMLERDKADFIPLNQDPLLRTSFLLLFFPFHFENLEELEGSLQKYTKSEKLYCYYRSWIDCKWKQKLNKKSPTSSAHI